MTPAEEHAASAGLPVVLITPFELLRIAEGNPMICTTLEAGEVLVRIPTAVEFKAVAVAARAELPANCDPGPPPDDLVDRAIAPLDLGSVR